jgi:2'-5' RNA ligase
VPVTHPQPFQADVVLARGRVPRDLAGRPVSGSWTARSVALVADRSSPRAPRYEDLGAFPLGS